jgi:hypothetical protein
VTASTDVVDWTDDEDKLIAQLESFHVAAQRDGLMSMVKGLNTRSQILAATTMGYTILHGTAVNRLAWAAPFKRQKLELKDFYADLIEGRPPLTEEIWEVS